MVVIGQLHTPAAFPKETIPEPTVQTAVWAPEPLSTFWRREKYSSPESPSPYPSPYTDYVISAPKWDEDSCVCCVWAQILMTAVIWKVSPDVNYPRIRSRGQGGNYKQPKSRWKKKFEILKSTGSLLHRRVERSFSYSTSVRALLVCYYI